MWVVVIIQLFVIYSILIMSILWFILGAIINPVAYLPYSSSAIVFLGVIEK